MKNLIVLIALIISSIIYSQENSETVTDIDGNVYKTIKIGTQIWMIENLKVTKYNGGTPILNFTDKNSWRGQIGGAYCWYNNEPSFKSIYGALYNFDAVKTGNLAPKGWHVATEEEWKILIDFLGGEKIAGEKLKESGTANWTNSNNANNSSGFTALPGGWRYAGESYDFMFIGDLNVFWTSTNKNFLQAKYVEIRKKSKGVNIVSSTTKSYGMSIRCIKD